MRSLAMLLVVVMVCCGGAVVRGQTPTPSPSPSPSPTCQPSSVDDVFLNPSVEVYEPDVPFSVTLMRLNNADWPTTPLGFSWATSFTDPIIFIAGQTVEFTIASPGPDRAIISCYAQGLGIREDCPVWSTSYETIYIPRFDYTPSPTPTPVTPTPSPTEISECVRFADYLNPPHDAVGVPTTVRIRTYGRFLGIEAGSGVDVEPDGDCCALVSGLKYNTSYVWYFSPKDDICITWFTTMEEPKAEGTGWMVLGEEIEPQSHEDTKEHEEEPVADR